MKDLSNYSLLAHNTFGIEARCSRFLEYSTVEEAQEIALLLKSPYLLIGPYFRLLYNLANTV